MPVCAESPIYKESSSSCYVANAGAALQAAQTGQNRAWVCWQGIHDDVRTRLCTEPAVMKWWSLVDEFGLGRRHLSFESHGGSLLNGCIQRHVWPFMVALLHESGDGTFLYARRVNRASTARLRL